MYTTKPQVEYYCKRLETEWHYRAITQEKKIQKSFSNMLSQVSHCLQLIQIRCL